MSSSFCDTDSSEVVATWAGKAGFSSDLATATAGLVLLESSPDQLAADLFELVGDGAFEAIQELLSVR